MRCRKGGKVSSEYVTQAQLSKAGRSGNTCGSLTPHASKESKYKCNETVGFAEVTILE
jgi:hypothetical protein